MLKRLSILASVALAGCYSGIGVDSAGGDDSPADGSGPNSGSNSGGGETDGDDPDTESGGPQTECDAPASGPRQLRRLTRSQYRRTIRDLLGFDADMVDGFEPDEVVAGFRNNIGDPITRVGAEDYMGAAEELAAEAVVGIDALVGCSGEGCAEAFIPDFGRKAWRRPLTTAEVDRLVGLHGTGDDFADGIRLVITAVLQSPNFLYHVELGEGEPDEHGRLQLSNFELASKLSYLLWDSMPDDALLDAAEQGRLTDRAELRIEAERLLADPRARDSIASLHRQWLSTPDYQLEEVSKNAEEFPEWSDSLRDAMAREIELRSDYHIRFGDGSLESLIASPITVVNDELAAIYGVDPVADAVELPAQMDLPPGFVGVRLDSELWAGALSQAGVMATLAKPADTNIPLRGRFVFESLLCGVVPDPPPDVDAEPPEADEGATVREKIEAETSVQPCAGCHQLINPLGFVLDNYDSIGRYRTTDAFDRPIDATMEYVYSDFEGEFDTAAQMVQELATTDALGACVAQKWFRFAFPVDPVNDTPEIDCALETLTTEFQETGYDTRELLLSIATSDAFRYRAAQEDG